MPLPDEFQELRWSQRDKLPHWFYGIDGKIYLVVTTHLDDVGPMSYEQELFPAYCARIEKVDTREDGVYVDRSTMRAG